jgi:hypothetical protein
MKKLFIFFGTICLSIFFLFSLNNSIYAECANQKGIDLIIDNYNSFLNKELSVAGQVGRLLNESEGGPGFVMKSRKGKDFFVTGGDIVVDEDGNVVWQIKKDINTTDAYGEPIIALVLIKIYPGDYVALEGNIVKKEILNFAMTISNIESFKSGYALTVSPNKNFHISISMPIHPNYDWVFSKNQSDFYCSSKARLLGEEMLAPTSGLIGTTNKNFTFKAGMSGFSSLKFDNLDYSDKNRPKRIESKNFLILIK